MKKSYKGLSIFSSLYPSSYYYNSPEQNAERRINKGKSGLEVFLYHYKGIETADRMSYN